MYDVICNTASSCAVLDCLGQAPHNKRAVDSHVDLNGRCRDRFRRPNARMIRFLAGGTPPRRLQPL